MYADLALMHTAMRFNREALRIEMDTILPESSSRPIKSGAASNVR